jgi:iron(III) transport system ATP-binding protein
MLNFEGALFRERGVAPSGRSGVSVRLDGITRRHGDGSTALSNVWLKIPPGRLTSVLGPSGCGKSTLLRLIAGLDEPDEGDIFIDGERVSDLSPAQRHVGLVVQSYALFPHLSVLENVAYGPRMRGESPQAAQRRAREVLASVGLEGLEDRSPQALSGGQQQRVALARALAHSPRLLLLDEPLSNLDARLRRQMRENIRALQQRLELTVVYVTHDQAEAMAVSDHLVVMRRGCVLQADAPDAIYRHPASEDVAVLMSDITSLRACVVESGVLDIHGHRVGHVGVAHLAPGDRVKLTVRPEAWQIQAAGGSGIPGRVIGRAYQGRITEYLIAVDWGRVQVTVWGPSAPLQPGSPVSLTLRATGVGFSPPEQFGDATD